MMKRILLLMLAAVTLAACTPSEEQLRKRAAELCQYIPDHTMSEEAAAYMTADFYAVLDTMFHMLPSHEAMDHEWLYYFVTGNGGTIADYEVEKVELTDATHAVATVNVRQQWEDGTAADDEIEVHRLYMELVEGQWLMSDFDEHKQDCINYIANNRKEQALRDAISDYLVKEIGSQYAQGELCIPTLMMVAEEEVDSAEARVWGDFWIFWYTQSGDTLKTVSGGNHSGCMTVRNEQGNLQITAFEQTTDGAGFEASARRIFGSHYDVYQNMHSNEDVREAVRKEQLYDYVRLRHLNISYYQDFGWPAVEIEN
jgi:hypothetical protein